MNIPMREIVLTIRLQEALSIARAKGHIEGDLNLSDVPVNGQRPLREMKDIMQMLRFGNLATMAAFTKGQAERLHLDIHDHYGMVVTLLVLGRKDNDWNHDNSRGDLLLKTLGLAIPLFPGDVVFFQPSILPHMVKKLAEDDIGKRVVVTLFNCGPTGDYLRKHDLYPLIAGQ
jgi:hypothetical protein